MIVICYPLSVISYQLLMVMVMVMVVVMVLW